MMYEDDEEEIKETHMTKECIDCDHLFDCRGMPWEVDQCLRFEPRRWLNNE